MYSLYISYFGLREPLVQTQVLPYLREIQKDGHGVGLITFEPEMRKTWSGAEESLWKARLKSEGIRWIALPYHKRPSLPATVYDILAGTLRIIREARDLPIDVLHARGYVPAAIAAIAKRFTKSKVIFDIRGLLPEEYADAGVWPRGGLLYRLTKAVEKYLIAASDGFVVLTDKAREILFPFSDTLDPHGRPIETIPCCVDQKRFRDATKLSKAQAKQRIGLQGRRVIVYVGALGGWYMTEEIAAFLAAAHRQDPSTFSIILTQSDPEVIAPTLRLWKVEPHDYLIEKVTPAEIPLYLRSADIALSLIKPAYSKLSSSPTKIAEYLASGLPIVCNAGVGDLDALIESDGVGVLLSEFNQGAYETALNDMAKLLRVDGIEDRCRASARKRFDLETVGGLKYRRLYENLSRRDSRERSTSRAA